MKQIAAGKMFILRFTPYQIIQYLLIFFVSSGVIAKQTPVKCAAHGEYCLNHWDCCSNACLSYMYRCARGQGVYPYPFLGISYKPAVTLEQILEQNFGSPNALPNQDDAKPYFASRFGAADDAAATEIKIVLQKSEEAGSEVPITKSPVDLTETSVVLENHHLDSTTLANAVDLEYHLDSSTLKSPMELEETSTPTEANMCDDKTEALLADSGLDTTLETVKRPSDKPSCAAIGQKCYVHENCCSQLCHGYLHQCVT